MASVGRRPCHEERGCSYLCKKIKPAITLRRLPFDDMESEFKCGRPKEGFHGIDVFASINFKHRTQGWTRRLIPSLFFLNSLIFPSGKMVYFKKI